MRTSRSIRIGALIIGTVAVTGIGAWAAVQQPTRPDRYEHAIAYFLRATDEYAVLHRRLERPLLPEKLFLDPAADYAAREALADAIRAARPLAREGDFFCVDVAEVLRLRIAKSLRHYEYNPEDVVADIEEETIAGARPPVVNESFSWELGNGIWPSLLQGLPRLPEELEYRFVGRDLVLLDLHANLVVDILRDALAVR